MLHPDVNSEAIADNARDILIDCTRGNRRVGDLFDTKEGDQLIIGSVYKVAELITKRVKNLKKSQEFAIWFSNEFESRIGRPAPDKLVNLMREVCVNLLAPHKEKFFNII